MSLQLIKKFILGYELPGFALIASALFVAPATFGAEMTKREFIDLVAGEYRVVAPAHKSLLNEENFIKIVEKDGEIVLSNHLAVGTKVSSTEYKVTVFECYNHEPKSTTCGFAMQLVDRGSFTHFLGVTPTVTVNRREEKLRLEIQPDFERAGERRPSWTFVEKK